MKKESNKPYKPQKNEPFKPIKKLSVQGVIQLWTHLRKYQQRLFIIMHKNNGMIDLQYVYTNSDKFEYNNGMYVIDKDYMRWSDGLNCFVAQYLECSALPINLEFDEKSTLEVLKENLAHTRVQMNVEPKILYSTVRSEVIQKLMRGEQLEKFFNFLRIVGVITLVGVVGVLLILFNKLM